MRDHASPGSMLARVANGFANPIAFGELDGANYSVPARARHALLYEAQARVSSVRVHTSPYCALHKSVESSLIKLHAALHQRC